MNKIFQDYYDGTLSGDETLKKVYSDYYKISEKWIQCENITIKALMNRICDEYEADGFDLESLPLDTIRVRFLEFEPKWTEPPEYRQFVEGKQLAESQLELIKNNKVLMSTAGIESTITQIEATIESFDKELLKLV